MSHWLNNEPNNYDDSHCKKAYCNNGGISLGNNEPIFREIISPRKMSNRK